MPSRPSAPRPRKVAGTGNRKHQPAPPRTTHELPDTRAEHDQYRRDVEERVRTRMGVPLDNLVHELPLTTYRSRLNPVGWLDKGGLSNDAQAAVEVYDAELLAMVTEQAQDHHGHSASNEDLAYHVVRAEIDRVAEYYNESEEYKDQEVGSEKGVERKKRALAAAAGVGMATINHFTQNGLAEPLLVAGAAAVTYVGAGHEQRKGEYYAAHDLEANSPESVAHLEERYSAGGVESQVGNIMNKLGFSAGEPNSAEVKMRIDGWLAKNRQSVIARNVLNRFNKSSDTTTKQGRKKDSARTDIMTEAKERLGNGEDINDVRARLVVALTRQEIESRQRGISNEQRREKGGGRAITLAVAGVVSSVIFGLASHSNDIPSKDNKPGENEPTAPPATCSIEDAYNDKC